MAHWDVCLYASERSRPDVPCLVVMRSDPLDALEAVASGV